MSNMIDRREFFRRVANPAINDPNSIEAYKKRTPRNVNLTNEQAASRFLAQATMGADIELIQYVANIGIEAWIDEQFNLPKSEILGYIYSDIFDESRLTNYEFPTQDLFRFALWQKIMTGEDQLRQRVALALSEIIVISTNTDDLYSAGNGVANWYDMLLEHAFGNFRDLIYEVTLSPIMGNFLSHAQNRKTDLSINRFPDENYAREVMQLFTIGLFELNEDGSFKLDSNNEPIPTYDNSHITELAKVFTGMTYNHDVDPDVDPEYPIGYEWTWLNSHTATVPMKMYEEEHELGEKKLLNGYVIPAGQSGLQDVSDAVDHLFNHPNVGPFIGRLLIQRLVKSNPSPGYISRVAAAFNDNGSGVRGDMQAVVKAIYLDDEARNESYLSDNQSGKLREPFFRYVHLFRAFNFNNPQNKFWDLGWSIETQLRQYMFYSPSVFNFFSPDYRPPGEMGAAGLTGPEFQLMNSFTAISMMNFWYSQFEWGGNFHVPGEHSDFIINEKPLPKIDQPQPDFSTELALVNADDIDGLIDHLDLLLTYGMLSNEMRTIIKTALIGMRDSDRLDESADRAFEIVKLAVYLFMVCPDYAIQL